MTDVPTSVTTSIPTTLADLAIDESLLGDEVVTHAKFQAVQ